MMDKKDNRDCPMCAFKNSMVYNPKTEHIIKISEEENLTVLGDGWHCDNCKRGGSFPDDIDPKKYIDFDKIRRANKW